ncbi:hypothetical protein J3L16_00370 [Alteromonas sp. 5E99-2]|uniref:hypothetical protein n=1 Tax=Alteromonas sp. 5E99-2 TaxID=2817683 RepID=UPI001A98366E|nr:hypothetical protein [Alteromonas sp. 5E99-2]MBO1254131.1 hypothetical protein [Alteromonas sp. 5E99-2]
MTSRSTSLYEFGYNFLGPICSEYFFNLLTEIELSDPSEIVFLAREGYFFSKAYQVLVDKGLAEERNRFYLLASRSFLFRITITDKNARSLSLNTKYAGTVKQLLMGRYGFTLRQVDEIFSVEELESECCLPEGSSKLEDLLNKYHSQLNDLIQPSKQAYLLYLQTLGLNAGSKPLLVDIGYSGTIQKLLTYLVGMNSSALYFITTQQGNQRVNENTIFMKSVFKDGVKMGDGYTMLDRSLLFESLLTSPNGQFIDIEKRIGGSGELFNFYFGRKSNPQCSIHDLERIFDGAIDNIVHNLSNGLRFSCTEIETLFEHYAFSRHFFPKDVWPLFDVDDAISGNGNVNPLQLFRI